MLRLCVAASVVSFCVSFTLPANSALRQSAKAAISTVQATHALFTAAAVGDRAAAVRWLAAGADATAKNDDGKRPFEVAMDAEHDALTAILLEAAGGIDARDEQGWTPLNWAILSGDWQLVRTFIRTGADIFVGYQNAWKVAELMESEMQLLEIIIAEQGVVDAMVCRYGRTALIMAVETGCIELVRKLLGSADLPRPVYTSGGSELTLAVQEGRTEIVKLLIANGSELNSRDAFYRSVLEIAVSYGHTEIVAMLIDAGADPNKGNWEFTFTALMHAAREGHTEIVKLLVDGGADLNARNYQKKTALDIAERHGHKEIAAILRAAGGSRGGR